MDGMGDSQVSKPRKKYKPKYVAKNPMKTFLGGMSGEHAAELVEIQAKTAAAMQAMVQGRGDTDAWDRLVGAINMANVMCEQGIGDEWRQQTIAARESLLQVGIRFKRTGRWLFTGDEMATINEGLSIHSAQVENVRYIDIERASDEVIRRVKHGVNTTNVQAEMERGKA